MMKDRIEKDKVIVPIFGDLNVEKSISLRKDLLNYVDKGYNHIVVDLKEMDDIDSTGLGVLVFINKMARKKNGEVSIKGLNGHAKQIFELTRLDQVFSISS